LKPWREESGEEGARKRRKYHGFRACSRGSFEPWFGGFEAVEAKKKARIRGRE
jgi:hypothetical protein